MDNYIHIDSNIYYITENIPGPSDFTSEYNTLIDAFNSQITRCCLCILCSNDCPCVSTYRNKNHLDQFNDFESVISLSECNDCCSCSNICNNRTVQRGPIENLYIKECELKGYGLFCKEFISKGSFICEYAGEILTKSEADRRHHSNSLQNKMNYILSLKEIVDDKIIETYVDPSMFGNIGRYINHCCEPNSIMIPIRVNSMIPKLALFSCLNIEPHTEITFNYGANNKILPQQFKVDRKKCLCNSSNCLGYLPFDP
ncbi:histone-lysine N-methyltransferase SETMAR-like isoform X1 [Pieris brassicae]|uniref:histone-lysine N-methyltransferase SETMAR-like isoform X1 n=1 Tax=Pieris brassicae TaxID=7116 RepID=UPI001E65EE5F|nr:histone-lysine N-methyltransferase SETMAR-like isoform X1 [Pieris brassicae]